MANKTWYSARILFVSAARGDDEERLCEESIIVVRAGNESEAVKAAKKLASKDMAVRYENEDGETVEWQFLRVLEVQDLCEEELEDGTEVFSRLFFESQATDPDIRTVLKEELGSSARLSTTG